MFPKVSVIIPVYGVELYIERCVRSLFTQTLDNLEYIFIDDCTPDNSIEILKRVLSEFPSRKEQVRIYRMPQNSGQAKVRNLGISLAKGEYTIHCDSDDWVHSDMYKQMYEAAKNNNADVVVCDFLQTDGTCSTYQQALPALKDNPLTSELNNWNCAGQLWNKMFRTSLYKKISLPKDNMGEDMAMVYQMVHFCKHIVYLPKPFYNFYVNFNSITHVRDDDKIYQNYLQTCNNALLVDRFYQNFELSESTRKALVRMKFQEKNKILSIIRHNKSYYQQWLKTFPELNKTVLLDSGLTLKEKLKYYLVLFHLYPLK